MVRTEYRKLIGEPKKSAEEVAREIYQGQGNWGNGQERIDKLTAAGYNATEVQNIVNSYFNPLKSIDEIAREVIDNKWGNGQERIDRLNAAGYNANEVQARVNEILKPVLCEGANVIIKASATNFATGQKIANFAKNRISKVENLKSDRALISYEGGIIGWIFNKDLEVK